MLLNDAWKDSDLTDADLIFMALNGMLSKSNKMSSNALRSRFDVYHKCFKLLLGASKVQRPRVSVLLALLGNYERTNLSDIREYISLNKGHISEPDPVHIWILCYYRTVFESEYASTISFVKPAHALRAALGENIWTVFMDSIIA